MAGKFSQTTQLCIFNSIFLVYSFHTLFILNENVKVIIKITRVYQFKDKCQRQIMETDEKHELRNIRKDKKMSKGETSHI